MKSCVCLTLKKNSIPQIFKDIFFIDHIILFSVHVSNNVPKFWEPTEKQNTLPRYYVQYKQMKPDKVINSMYLYVIYLTNILNSLKTICICT